MDRWQCLACGYIHKGSSPPNICPSCGAPFTAFERWQRDPKARFRSYKVSKPNPAGYRYVIIGNSSAGRSAARAIQALDPHGKIIVISEETADIYYRPLLPDYMGGMSREDFFSMSGGFEKKGLELILGDAATAIDSAAKQVILASGRTVQWDALLLGVGASALQIPWPGSEAEGIAYFRTFEDAERIAALAENAKHAVVVGGGLLGLEFVRAFNERGIKITQLVRETRVGFPAVDETGAPILEAALKSLGVELILEDEVASFEQENGRVCAVITSKGRRIDCDLVGVAVGVRTRLDLAKTAGCECDRGILVDMNLQTSVPGIYAAGDCAQAFDRIWGERRINTSWRNSQEQGEAAGILMAGGDYTWPGAVAANYQLAAGVPFCALGIANPPNPQDFEIAVTVDLAAGKFRKIVRLNGTIVGACLVGDLSEAGEFETQIRSLGVDGSATPEVPKPQVNTSTPPVNVISDEKNKSEEEIDGMLKMTEQFLKEAFAGESQAHMKYMNFAEKAASEGKDNVARIFKAASFAEQVHASQHLKVLEGIGETADNLEEAMTGENFEVEEMYPAFMAVALEQDEMDAHQAFNHAMQAEQVHYDLYVRAKDAVVAGNDVTVDKIWVCSECGNTVEGEEAPAKCALCGAPKKYFVEF